MNVGYRIELMVTNSNELYRMHSKMGWTNQIGWDVGYIDAKNNRWIFAMNLDIIHEQDAKYRKEIICEILKFEMLDSDQVANDLFKYAVILTRFKNEWIFVRHE